jgi:hypothetical protein
MIVRILGEGQYTLADAHLNELNRLDAHVQSAFEADDEQAFTEALSGLLAAVRRLGTPLAAGALTPSELVLPDEGRGMAEVAALLTDEGLIPG